MEKREINPTEWLQAFNINHGIEVTGGQRGLYLSGQTANAADGAAMHPGDLVAQFRLAWSNVKDSLAVAGMDPSNIVRLNMYTTDVDGFMAAAGEIVPSSPGTVVSRLVRSSVSLGSSSLRSWSTSRQQPLPNDVSR